MSENPYEASHEAAAAPIQRQGFRFPWVSLLAGFCVVVILIGLLLPIRRSAPAAARRMGCSNNLKRIALALRNYESTYQSLPPAYTVDSSGNRLQSWRVLILPFLEEQQLYDSIDLNRRWDDPANAEAGSRMPSVYSCPSTLAESNETTYKAIVTIDSCFPHAEARRLSEITDALYNTAMLIESSPATAVHWMSPNDADIDFVVGFGPETQFAHQSGTHMAFADGAVVFLIDNASESLRRALVSVNGGEDLSETLN